MPAQGSTTERGYGTKHQQLRAWWAPRVATGKVRCHRPTCRKLIERGEPWDLGHTEDRTAYTGPEHRDCNRRHGQQLGQERRRAASMKSKRSRAW